MVRIDIDDEVMRLYVLAYLQAPVGQTLPRRNRSGSVIDHITADDVGAIPVPILPDQEVHRIASRLRNTVTARQATRSDLRWALQQLEDSTTQPKRWTSWVQPAGALLKGRLDAAYHHPAVQQARQQAATDGGVLIGALADARLPIRYKRYSYKEEMAGRL